MALRIIASIAVGVVFLTGYQMRTICESPALAMPAFRKKDLKHRENIRDLVKEIKELEATVNRLSRFIVTRFQA